MCKALRIAHISGDAETGQKSRPISGPRQPSPSLRTVCMIAAPAISGRKLAGF
jgi:hypothetical protein